MSKITPKNLSYDDTLPPFLQRLRGDFASSSADGRHERAIARPKRARNPEDDAEDEPTYFDEETNHTFSKSEYEELVKKDLGEEGKSKVVDIEDIAKEPATETNEEGEGKKEKLAAIGGSKKRKQGRVVGADEDEDGGIAAAVKKAAALVGEKGKVTDVKKVERKVDAPKKKRAKTVKLSFGDEEEGG